MSFDSIESTGSMQSNLISEISIMSLEDNYEDILESTDEAEILKNLKILNPNLTQNFLMMLIRI
jgi:hypothetical protein